MYICVHRRVLRLTKFRACTNFAFVRSVPRNQYYIPITRTQLSSLITHVYNSGDPEIKSPGGHYQQPLKLYVILLSHSRKFLEHYITLINGRLYSHPLQIIVQAQKHS
jgi:hypothetical protein